MPPGDDTVLHRILLDGKFRVSECAIHHAEKIKEIMVELSRRGQGRPDDESIVDVPAEFAGDFHLQKSDLNFRQLQIRRAWGSGPNEGLLRSAQRAGQFRGRCEASMPGFRRPCRASRRIVLIPFDPLFMKHGAGTYLPVAIGGTRQHPEVRLQLGKIF